MAKAKQDKKADPKAKGKADKKAKEPTILPKIMYEDISDTVTIYYDRNQNNKEDAADITVTRQAGLLADTIDTSGVTLDYWNYRDQPYFVARTQDLMDEVFKLTEPLIRKNRPDGRWQQPTSGEALKETKLAIAGYLDKIKEETDAQLVERGDLQIADSSGPDGAPITPAAAKAPAKQRV